MKWRKIVSNVKYNQEREIDLNEMKYLEVLKLK